VFTFTSCDGVDIHDVVKTDGQATLTKVTKLIARRNARSFN
jgi:hypothetical protein